MTINPTKDYKILKAVKALVKTELDPTAIGILVKAVLGLRNSMTLQVLLTDLLVNPSITPTYDKQYVLIPKVGNGKWEDINKWFSSILN